MNVSGLHERLRQLVGAQRLSGGISQTALAKAMGIEQAHVSNFVHGRRMLSIEVMDRMLEALHLEVEALISPADHISRYSPDVELGSVPLVARSSAELPLIPENQIQEFRYFKKKFLRRLKEDCPPQRRNWSRFIAVKANDADCLFGNGKAPASSIVLLDRHCCSLSDPRDLQSWYLVRQQDRFVIRRVELQGKLLCLRPQSCDAPLHVITLSQQEKVASYILGRIAHVSTSLEQ